MQINRRSYKFLLFPCDCFGFANYLEFHFVDVNACLLFSMQRLLANTSFLITMYHGKPESLRRVMMSEGAVINTNLRLETA